MTLSIAYQMSVEGRLGFRRMLIALAVGDYQGAAMEMLDSKWARSDSSSRAERLVRMMREG